MEHSGVANGKVFLACVDRQRICVLDANSGKSAWQFTPGARMEATDRQNIEDWVTVQP